MAAAEGNTATMKRKIEDVENTINSDAKQSKKTDTEKTSAPETKAEETKKNLLGCKGFSGLTKQSDKSISWLKTDNSNSFKFSKNFSFGNAFNSKKNQQPQRLQRRRRRRGQLWRQKNLVLLVR